MDSILSTFRQSIGDHGYGSGWSDFLAVTLMLTSITIVSPIAFDDGSAWCAHLRIAHQIITKHCGVADKSPHSHDPSNDVSEDVRVFLIQWFTRFDVQKSILGATIGNPHYVYGGQTSPDTPLLEPSEIGCVLGFTGQLARDLVQIENEVAAIRIAHSGSLTSPGPPDPVEALQGLSDNINESRVKRFQGCSCPTNDSMAALEQDATNTAFHWTAKLCMYLALPSQDHLHYEYTRAVREIIIAMHKVREGGSAERCMVTPMFVAGCAAWRLPAYRVMIIKRFKDLETLGMVHVSSSISKNVGKQITDEIGPAS